MRTRQTRKERCPFQHINLAGCGGQLLQFIECQIVLLYILGLDFVEEVIDILTNQFVAVGDFQQSPKGREVTCRRVTTDFSVGQPQLVRAEQIFPKTFAQFDGDIAEGAVPAREVGEVAIYGVPLFVLFAAHLSEVGEKISAHLVVVEKVEFIID